MDPTGRSPKAQFKLADREKAAYCLTTGDSELANGTVMLKDMKSKEETSVPRLVRLSALFQKSSGPNRSTGVPPVAVLGHGRDARATISHQSEAGHDTAICTSPSQTAGALNRPTDVSSSTRTRFRKRLRP